MTEIPEEAKLTDDWIRERTHAPVVLSGHRKLARDAYEQGKRDERIWFIELFQKSLVSHILQDGDGEWSIPSHYIKAFFRRWKSLKGENHD